MRQRVVPLVIALIMRGQLIVLFTALRRKLYSNRLAFGLRRDLTVPLAAIPAKLPLSVRPISDEDISVLLATDAEELTSEGIYERLLRLELLQAKIPTCYTAVTSDNNPCYMQWLIGPSENDKVQAFFHGFPLLAPDEALLEGAFTLEAYRGQGIMPCAMLQIAQIAQKLGVRWVVSFVDTNNIPSLKGYKHAGFVPFLLRKEKWRLFRKQVTFASLPAS